MRCVKVSEVFSTLLRTKANMLTVLKGPHDLYSPLLVIYMVFSTIVPQAILTSLHPHWPLVGSQGVRYAPCFGPMCLEASSLSYPPD